MEIIKRALALGAVTVATAAYVAKGRPSAAIPGQRCIEARGSAAALVTRALR